MDTTTDAAAEEDGADIPIFNSIYHQPFTAPGIWSMALGYGISNACHMPARREVRASWHLNPQQYPKSTSTHPFCRGPESVRSVSA